MVPIETETSQYCFAPNQALETDSHQEKENVHSLIRQSTRGLTGGRKEVLNHPKHTLHNSVT